MLPLRFTSRMWGCLNSIDLPVFMREPIYMAWTRVFGVHLDEMRDPIDSYPNLGAFFVRHLKDGVRPLAPEDLV
jgi:phosphatidylserine decarboxylase